MHGGCFTACHPVALEASLREVHLVGLQMVVIDSGPLSCVDGFTVQELHQMLVALLTMFSFVWCVVGRWCEVVLFLVAALMPSSLLETQISVSAMLVACISIGLLVRCLWIDLEQFQLIKTPDVAELVGPSDIWLHTNDTKSFVEKVSNGKNRKMETANGSIWWFHSGGA